MDSKEDSTSSFFTPFTTGNITEQSTNRTTDGSIASTVTTACLLAIFFVIIANFCTIEKYDDLAKIAAWAIVMGWVVIGLVSLVILSTLIYRNKSYWTARNQVNDPSTRMKIVFLWIFGLGLILQESLFVSADIECITKDTVYETTSIASSFVLVVYMCFQTSFITLLRDLKFVSSLKINYCIAFIVIANACTWFIAAVKDVQNIYNANNNRTGTNSTSPSALHSNCFSKSPIEHIVRKLLPYFVPMRMEFCLLAIAFILSMWPSVNSLNLGSEDSAVSNTQAEEQQTATQGPPRYRINVHSNRSSASVIVAVITAVLIYLPVFILTALLVFVYRQNNGFIFMLWEILLTIQTMAVFIMVLLGFHVISKYSYFQTGSINLAPNEYILIISAAGKTAYNTFGVLSGMKCKCTVWSLVLGKNILVILCIFLQTILIISSKRYKRMPNVGQGISAYIFMSLFISNMCMWFNNTFVGMRGTVISEGQNELLDQETWRAVEHVLFPLVIYYHFHCAMDLYGLYHRYK